LGSKKIKKIPSFYRIFFLSKIQDGAHIQYGVFWHLFQEALAFVKNFKMQKFLHILEEQTQKNCSSKINSKWPLNSRWLPKLNLLVKTTNHIFSKKKSKLTFIEIFFLKNSRWRPYSKWKYFGHLFEELSYS
jgi:hypothetical protein